MEIVFLLFLTATLNHTLGLVVNPPHSSRIQYNRDILLGFQSHGFPEDLLVDFSPSSGEYVFNCNNDFMRTSANTRSEARRRKRGKKGGVRQRLRKLTRANRLPLPSIVLSNVQSLKNKTDELQACVSFMHEFRDVCVLALTETWLTDADPDSTLIIDGFGAPIRLDRDPRTTGKSRGGGVCLYINPRWCTNVTVRERICLPDIELLSVSVRPFYLPREFPQIFLTVVYIHPSANANAAADVIHSVSQRLQSLSPDAPSFFLGDFNHVNCKKSLNGFKQYVTCLTRGNNTLDLCYGSIKGAYTSVAGPPLGSSDHNVVHLLPTYKSVLRRDRVQTHDVQVWNEESTLALQGCFDCTIWSVFEESSNSIDELADVVCSYISFCTASVIPHKKVFFYPNSKPWITKELKSLLREKKTVFKNGDKAAYAQIRKVVRAEIIKAKSAYKEKIESKLYDSDLKSVWNGMKLMTGLQKCNNNSVSSNGFTSNMQLADELNKFYLRFNVDVFDDKISNMRELVRDTSAPDIDLSYVTNLLKQTKVNKSPGPDNISGRVLKSCASQLSGILKVIFTQSLQLQTVPKVWKHATIVPVAKTKSPKVLNDFRPIALTSLVMKVLEKLVKKEVLKQVKGLLDPLQFAYQAGRGVEDATLFLINVLVKHLEAPKTHARLLFVDFSSAFNTIQPYLLAEKLTLHFNLNPNLVGWLLDFLLDRSQCVRVNGVLSSKLLSSTGSPQGCVLSSLLFILYTNSCRSTYENRHILKFADDSVIISLLKDSETEHGTVVDDFITWCNDFFLSINVLKTKDMLIDFRKSQPITPRTIIQDKEVEIVSEYKYLGTLIDNKLSFDANTDVVCKKVQQRLFFLRKLNSFKVCNILMTLFYQCFIESVLTYCCVAWFGFLTLSNKNRLARLTKVASKVIGVQQAQLQDIYLKRIWTKAKLIIDCPDHPLYKEFDLLPSGRRFRMPKTRTKRARVSFVPAATDRLNFLG